jgi:RNA polymerase primary sigma factor
MTNEELVNQIQKGINPGDNMEQLYRQNKGYIFKIARRYTYVDDIEDLMQEAYFGLYEAVQRYEDTAGVLFMSYASFWIKQAITRYLEDNGRTVRITNAMYNKIMRYKRLVSAYEMELGRKPTNGELRMHLGVSQKVLEGIEKAHHEFYSMGSLDIVIPGVDDNMQLSEIIADPDTDVENSVIDEMIEESKRTELWQIVKDNVTPEQNTVITARYRKSMTLDATGQVIGKSREMVRNLEAQALRKLRLARIRRLLEEKFEINYARAYNGSLTSFRNRWTSIVEDIAIRNIDEVQRS